ncbi:MAG: hypothetical protein FWE25_03390 [Lachnospiraceae bacterium]|nr:hypothetical protein [Lachnospiraceae bacterium]
MKIKIDRYRKNEKQFTPFGESLDEVFISIFANDAEIARYDMDEWTEVSGDMWHLLESLGLDIEEIEEKDIDTSELTAWRGRNDSYNRNPGNSF